MNKLFRIACISAALTAPWPAQAFGPDGHQQVAAIAATLIQGSRAEREVAARLQGVPLTVAAVWADCAKGVAKNKRGKYLYTINPKRFPECKPFNTEAGAARFVNFVLNNLEQCGKAKGSEYCHNQYHYTDVSPFRSRYDASYVGAQPWDVVHAITAALTYLRDGKDAVPAPFKFADDTEALMLLVHYVGDIHQPLHATALYLDGSGAAVDPDATGYRADTDTNGGNFLVDEQNTVAPTPPDTKPFVPKLHGEWDAIDVRLRIGGASQTRLLQRAAAVADTPGNWRDWSAQWASEAIVQAQEVFGGLRFGPATSGAGGRRSWTVNGVDAAYQLRMTQIKETQLARGGARLAQLLKAVWPDPVREAPSAAAGQAGYLGGQALPDIRLWLTAAPARYSAAEADDIDVFKLGRPQIAAARGMEAALDDVFEAELIVARFAEALGGTVSAQQAPTLMKLIDKVKSDAERLVAPVKLKVVNGGRERPLVTYAEQPNCLYPRDLAGHREADIGVYKLPESGSYPSTHALVGMMVGMVLSQARTERSDMLIARGLAFGDSRVVCGFHYPSDVAAGRLAAAVLFAKLEGNADFVADMALVKNELAVRR